LVGRQTHTGVADGDDQLTILAQFRLNPEFTANIHHRLYAIEHEVHQHLLQSHAICGDFGGSAASSVRMRIE
jgi:hypothetical protein